MVGVPPRPAPSRSLLSRWRHDRSLSSLGELRSQVGAWCRWVGVGRIVLSLTAAAVTAVGGVWLIRTPDPEAIHNAALAEARAATYEPVTPTEYTLSVGPILRGASAGSSDNDPIPLDDLDQSGSGSDDGSGAVQLVVHVVGAVVAPGVYSLDRDARVIDAVRAAGGPTDQAQLDAMNLAATIGDGQRLVVPTISEVRSGVYQAPAEPGPAPTMGSSSSGNQPTRDHRIDINTASEEELTRLPGVGPATAAAIVADRSERGPFATVDELIRVRGIGPAKLNALRAQARV